MGHVVQQVRRRRVSKQAPPVVFEQLQTTRAHHFDARGVLLLEVGPVFEVMLSPRRFLLWREAVGSVGSVVGGGG